MSKLKLPSQMHPEYPKGWKLKDKVSGCDIFYPAPLAWLQAFYDNHPEFDNEGEYQFQCPYCGSQINCEPTDLCCGEVHGEWVYVPLEDL